MAEDVIKGSVAAPKSLNRYGYCWNSLLRYIDADGNDLGLVNVDIMTEVTKIIIKGVGDVISYVNGANESYLRQLEAKPAPVMPTDPTGLPDLTEEIDEWLLGKEKEFQEIMDMYKGGAQGLGQYMAVYLNASLEFYNQVKTGGEMDIKEIKRWNDAFGVDYPSFFIYRGDIMDPGTLGNITYGYIGASLFPDFMLYMGGGYAGMDLVEDGKYVYAFPFSPLYGDKPEAHEAIKKS